MDLLTEYLDKELSRKPKWHDFLTLNKVVIISHTAEDITDEQFEKMVILSNCGYKFLGPPKPCKC